MNRLSGVPWVLVLAACLVGCSQRAAPPPRAKVQGTVLLDGNPMGGGEIRFTIPGQPAQSLPIKDGAFSGEVFTGTNHVEVVWDVDGPPNPTDPSSLMKVNQISSQYLGPSSPLSAEVGPKGAQDLKFEVASAGG